MLIHITNGSRLSRLAILECPEGSLHQNVDQTFQDFALSSINCNSAGTFIENVNYGKVTLWKANLSSEFSLLEPLSYPRKDKQTFLWIEGLAIWIFALCQMYHQALLCRKTAWESCLWETEQEKGVWSQLDPWERQQRGLTAACCTWRRPEPLGRPASLGRSSEEVATA